MLLRLDADGRRDPGRAPAAARRLLRPVADRRRGRASSRCCAACAAAGAGGRPARWSTTCGLPVRPAGRRRLRPARRSTSSADATTACPTTTTLRVAVGLAPRSDLRGHQLGPRGPARLAGRLRRTSTTSIPGSAASPRIPCPARWSATLLQTVLAGPVRRACATATASGTSASSTGASIASSRLRDSADVIRRNTTIGRDEIGANVFVGGQLRRIAFLDAELSKSTIEKNMQR